MKKILFLSFLFLYISSAIAQEGSSVFNFLKLPNSARANALGGTNVSIIENDLSLVFQNPGFLGQEMDMNLTLGYMSYIADVGIGNAIFAKSLGERSTWGVGVNYTNYGNLKEVTSENVILGDLSANDICGNIFFSRDLTEKLRGGVTAKIVYSSLGEYTSIGLGVDIGLSYYDSEREFSMGLVGKNLGRQVQSYNEDYEGMPWDIQFGITKRLSHAPIRFSITTMYLNKWKFYNVDGEEDSFGTTLAKHFVLGVDFLPSDNLWVGLGYNIKTAADMKVVDANKMAGFSIGAGLKVKAFNIGCSVGQYHPSATSFMLNLTTSFSEFRL